MEVNKEEALRCLQISQRHRSASNWPSALKFALKSVSLYPTPEGKAMVALIEREMSNAEANGASSSSAAGAPPTPSSRPSAGVSSSSARATGVEEHLTSAHTRHPKKQASTETGSDSDKGKKREYTVKQLEVVTRIKRCRDHQYYEILAVERTCSEGEVKKAYKKLALALHPDKNGAPGADEAFKMVSKAFQVLSDQSMRSVYDSNPTVDPTQRGGGGGGGGGGMSGMRGFGGGMHPGFQGGFQGEMSPDDLFNMFFGGGMNSGFGGGGFGGGPRVYTFGGRGGQQINARRPRAAAGGMAADETSSPFLALLPVALLLFFVLFSVLPGLFSADMVPDPEYRFKPSTQFDAARTTWQRNVPYHVNSAEWEKSNIWQSVPENRRDRLDAAMFSSKLRGFERGVEETHIRALQSECHTFNVIKQRKIAEETGLFGWGADYDKIRKLRAEKSPSCEKLRGWGVTQQAF